MDPAEAPDPGLSLRNSDRWPSEDTRHRNPSMQTRVNSLISTPFRVGRHLAIWLVWQSTGVSLLPPSERR